ncbi:MAG TPA: hypothetical protein VMM13_04005 [Euzebya sp.]|nr:hypothetical protein [Euzebya sp.]
MQDLLSNPELDPLLSSIGLVVIVVGIRMVLGTVKTAIRLLFLGGLLIGAYLFFYGGAITG